MCKIRRARRTLFINMLLGLLVLSLLSGCSLQSSQASASGGQSSGNAGASTRTATTAGTPINSNATATPALTTTTTTSSKLQDQWVTRQPYDAQGDMVPDFSEVGYAGKGTQNIPNVTNIVETLAPRASAADDTARIQQAIENVGRQVSSSHPGVLLLKAGKYYISGALKIDTSGVVLRGAGRGATGTILVAEGKPHELITMGGSGTWRQTGDAYKVTDTYVPLGANSFHVTSTAGLKVGDKIIVQRPQSVTWVAAIGMNRIPARPDGTPSHPWPASAGLLFDRVITKVDTQNKQITIDVPLTNALEKKYTSALVWKYTFTGRISNVGLEDLSSDATAFTHDAGSATIDGASPSQFMKIDATENGWMQEVTFSKYVLGILIGITAKSITVNNTTANMDVPKTSAAPGIYTIAGQQVLVSNCVVTGNYVHAWTTAPSVPGPDVFFNCSASGTISTDAGPHQRWATGILFDNITVAHGFIELMNRSWMGTGQGWAAANSVMWNSTASTYSVENPPTAKNWAVGIKATLKTPVDKQKDQGTIIASGKTVMLYLNNGKTTNSLYEAQLSAHSSK